MGKYNNQDNDNYLLDNNKLGIISIEELRKAEAFVFSIRAAELERQEYKLYPHSIENFKKLHYHLFQDIYQFAGCFRNVQFKKGNTNFCQFQYIDNYSSYIFKLLNEEPSWSTLKDAAERLAFFKFVFNMIHPFFEVNLRKIRIFILLYVLSIGCI